MRPAVGDVLNRLEGVKAAGRNKWKALCPAHDDRNPSLSITEGDGGKVLLHCHAGCAWPDILTALGFSANGNGANSAAATPPQPKAKTRPARRIVATYDYHDTAGQVIFQKVRYEPKEFSQRRPDGRGGWIWNLGDVAPVLYRLPQLIDPAAGWQPVYVCEGEKDVDRVASLGLVATCNFDGAGKWRVDYNAHFAGRVVYVMADNDDAGRAHTEHVARHLHGVAQAVKVVNLSDVPDKGDVSDWLDAGHTKEELEHECLMSPVWEPSPRYAAGQLVNVLLNGRIQNPTPGMIAEAHPPVNGAYGYTVAWTDGTVSTYEEGNLEPAAMVMPDVTQPDIRNSAAGPVLRDDTGNSERFTAQHGDNVRFNHSTGHWYIWAGTHWRRDDDGGIQRLAKMTVRAIYEEAAAAAKAGGDELAAQLSKWARASAAESRRNAMLNLAQSEYPVALTHDRLNTHDLLLNCRNGTLDLTTGVIRPHDRGDLLTYVLPVDYDPAAVAPVWDAFLWRIMNGDADMIRFLAAAVGYTLSGLTAAQVLFFLYGRGANGKSTFIETIMALLGDLGHKARAQVLMISERDRIPNEIAALAGKRLVVTSELSDGGRLNEGLVKDMTGGDSMSARFLHKEPFTFRPQFKLWMYGNHKPVITGTDDGIWRRVRLIPFTVQIPEDERDTDLPGKLRGELPGILAWAVRGWKDYQAIGLDAPAAVTQATTEYRADSDTLGLFLEERCIMGADKSVTAGDLYADYSEWSLANGLRALSNVRFGRSLGERGYTKERRAGGRWQYQGVGLLVERGTSEQFE